MAASHTLGGVPSDVIDFVLEHSGKHSMRLLRLPPLARLGQVSYGLYLYHFPVLAILLDIARGLGFTGKVYPLKVLSIVLSIALARLSWRFIERPLLSLKDRFAYAAEGATNPARARTACGRLAH
jgi:peptidoglycan/LPS O-acetylase OafA/YrhL